MDTEKILDNTRIRKTHNGFGFIPHRFLRDGFLSSLRESEVYLYVFYVLAANRFGISFYSDRRICDILSFSIQKLRNTRDNLIQKDLICCQDPFCQVLELPYRPVGLDGEDVHAVSFSSLHRRLEV